jgi:heat shock protein HtpX
MDQNAFATGRGPGHAAIAVTSGLLERLTTRELRGVMAHEMAHVANRDVLIASVAAGLAAIVSAVANAVQFSALFRSTSSSGDDEQSSLIGAPAFALVAPLAATLVQLAISRWREYVADATAARLTGDPEALASALARLARAAAQPDGLPAPAAATASLFIVNPLSGAQGLMTLLSTHPPMDERIARLLRMARRPLRAA